MGRTKNSKVNPKRLVKSGIKAKLSKRGKPLSAKHAITRNLLIVMILVF